jgi:hypothetical protein
MTRWPQGRQRTSHAGGSKDESFTLKRRSRRQKSSPLTAELLDRLTHRCQIFEMNSESFRFRASIKNKKSKKSE